ncbi:MAG: hypothetical protein ACR2RL_23050, partial [Gammaproteobacteria bacterium]
SVVTVDPVSGDFLVLAEDDSFWRFDILADTWVQLPSGNVPVFVDPPNQDPTFHTVATPVDTYGVVMVLQWRPQESKVWLYKHVASGDTTAPARVSNLKVE